MKEVSVYIITWLGRINSVVNLLERRIGKPSQRPDKMLSALVLDHKSAQRAHCSTILASLITSVGFSWAIC